MKTCVFGPVPPPPSFSKIRMRNDLTGMELQFGHTSRVSDELRSNSWSRISVFIHIHHLPVFWGATKLPSSSARIVTPRLQACTPCITESFRTSMISSNVAPAFIAFLM